MQNFFIGAVIFLSVILQTSFLPNIFPVGFVPDITLIFIAIWTARIDFNSGLKWAIFGGLAMDLMSFYPVGINVFSFACAVFVVNSFSKRFLVPQLTWKFMVLAVIIFLVTMMNQIITRFILGIFVSEDWNASMRAAVDSRLLWRPFCNLGIFAIIYWPIRRLDKFFSYQNQRVIIKRHV